MKRYTFETRDWDGFPVRLTVVAKDTSEAEEMATAILEGAASYIDPSLGNSLVCEEKYV